MGRSSGEAGKGWLERTGSTLLKECLDGETEGDKDSKVGQTAGVSKEKAMHLESRAASK